ncbi:MAG: cobyrinate a,c-diamide synthase [Terriglobales bacterium]
MTDSRPMPRLLIAGMSGGSGKTLVSLALLLALRRAGVQVRAFKKGPDYIDAAWLGWAAGHPARNMDTYLMGQDTVRSSFAHNAITDGINLIEGNRGVFDGFDAAGTHSSAALSHCLGAPVVLVINAAKVTRTAAAFVVGCQTHDPELPVRGIILNNVSGQRHEEVLRASIQSTCSIPVIGTIRRAAVNPLPERYLGLVPPQEYGATGQIQEDLMKLADGLDLDAILSIARSAPLLAISPSEISISTPKDIKVGCLRDSAFSFYYPENLEQLERGGAELIPISSLESSALPEGLRALYIGGGFPEKHAEVLSSNRSFLESIRQAALGGLPIYAECGGLILLARSLRWNGRTYPMAGVFPFEVEGFETPQGHGYSELHVDRPNPFFPTGLVLRGHEFHYSRISLGDETVNSVGAVIRGAGCFQKRDLVITNNMMAAYTHLHALATPEWAKGFLDAARRFAFPATRRNMPRAIEVRA